MPLQRRNRETVLTLTEEIMKYVYHLKNLENGYVWGNFAAADDAFDAIAADPDYAYGHIVVVREQV